MKLHHHARGHVVKLMAVHYPLARIVRIERHFDNLHWRHEYGVAYSSLQSPATNSDHLKMMAMQVNRVRHHRSVLERKLDSLALFQFERRMLSVRLTVEGPAVGLH